MHLFRPDASPLQASYQTVTVSTYTKKARESVPVARPAHQGSRIAHLAKTSNAEAHADMYIYTRYAAQKRADTPRAI